jgi:hypothetical protein
MNKQHLDQVLEFIRQHRSNEANFDTLNTKLEEEHANEKNPQQYVQALKDIKEKQAEEYRKNKSMGGSAWPEFEKFVSQFEKAITEALGSET